jgi:hypothetical protein
LSPFVSRNVRGGRRRRVHPPHRQPGRCPRRRPGLVGIRASSLCARP